MKRFTPIAAAALLAAIPMVAHAETISPDGSALPDLITPDTVSPDSNSPDMVAPGALPDDNESLMGLPDEAQAPDRTILTAATTGAESADTSSFVTAAASANQFEIETSQLAEKQADAKDVKNFAREMVRDHERIGKHFETALHKGKVAAPEKGLSSDDQAKLDELNGLKSADFDAKYIDLQTAAHHDAVALFSGYAKSGDDKALKNFAKDTLPMLEKHLKHVEKLGKAHHV